MAKAILKQTEPTVRTRVNFAQSTHRRVQNLKTRYQQAVGFDVSYSLLVAIALDALDEEIGRGVLRRHGDLYVTAT